VRNHHHLCALTELTDRVTKSSDVRLIEGGVNFVQDYKWQWAHGKHSEQQRYTRKCALTT
jgi:hypothetical protein